MRRARETLGLLDDNHRAVVLVEDDDRIVFATEHAHELLAQSRHALFASLGLRILL